jgi:hypothetical protein
MRWRVVDSTDDDLVDDSKEGEEVADEGGRGRREGLLPSLVKKALAQGVEVLTDEGLRETLVTETLRRAIEKGSEVVDVTEDSVRRLVGELPVTKELGDRLLQRVDDHKNELFGLIKHEIRDLAERVDVVSEIQSVLAGMTLEVNAQVRFVRNEDGSVATSAKRKTTKRTTSDKKRPARAAKKTAKPRTKKTSD